MLGACSHENLIRLLGFAADKGAHQGDDGVCLVTPLMKGGSLEDRLMLDEPARRRLALMPGAPRDGFPPLTWQQLLGVALGAVRGLEYLHTPDPAVYKPVILHRDIKPSNVLLDRDGNARLSDMGLAREQRPAAAHVTTMTTIAGTNGYIDDNYQVSGRYDESADGFAMGVTLLVILTGRRATDPVRGHIIGQCEVDDASEVAEIVDARAGWPREVSVEVHSVAMAPVKRNRARRITVAAARQRLEALASRHLPRPLEAEVVLERECMLCMSAPRHVRFPCGHSSLCQGCVGPFMQRREPVCPICRARVTQQGLIVSADVAREDTFVQPRRS